MNIIFPNLLRQLDVASVSPKELADAIGVEIHIFEKKLQGLLPLKLHEAVKICLYLNYPDAKYLFFQLDNSKFQLESQENIGR